MPRPGLVFTSCRMMVMPAVMSSWVLRRFSWRPRSWDAQVPELGMTCMTPMAPAEDVTFWRKLDSCSPNVRASAGSTPMD